MAWFLHHIGTGPQNPAAAVARRAPTAAMRGNAKYPETDHDAR
jgi:hypothetical protein